jgi:hypothetical protein
LLVAEPLPILPRSMTPDRLKWLAILAAVVAVFLCYELLIAFYDWNKTQSCATFGGRNCGIYRH